MTQLIDHFSVAIDIPARRAERLAQGLDPTICTMVVGAREAADVEQLARATEELLPKEKEFVALILGDFGADVSSAVPGLKRHSHQLPGITFHNIHDAESLRGLFGANVEMVALFRCTAESLQIALEQAKGHVTPWWKLARKSDIGVLGELVAAVGLVALYSPTEMAVEFLGTENMIVDAFSRFERSVTTK